MLSGAMTLRSPLLLCWSLAIVAAGRRQGLALPMQAWVCGVVFRPGGQDLGNRTSSRPLAVPLRDPVASQRNLKEASGPPRLYSHGESDSLWERGREPSSGSLSGTLEVPPSGLRAHEPETSSATDADIDPLTKGTASTTPPYSIGNDGNALSSQIESDNLSAQVDAAGSSLGSESHVADVDVITDSDLLDEILKPESHTSSSAITAESRSSASDLNPQPLVSDQSSTASHAAERGSEVLHRDPDADVVTQETHSIPTAALYSPREPSHPALISSEYEEAYLIGEMVSRFRGRVVRCCSPAAPYCDIFLCGTLHVAHSSTDMVREAIRVTTPDFVVVEVCEARIDNLCEAEEHLNITLREVVGSAWAERSFKQLGMGLLSWMQTKAAKGLNSQLGGELAAATKEGVRHGATIVLGDRLYAVTIQRIFDRLGVFEKVKMGCIMVWEALTMSLGRLREYVRRSESEEDFVQREIAKFGRYLPSVAEVVIHERDEYLAQSAIETARVGYRYGRFGQHRRGRIVVVIGAGHLQGVQKWLDAGGVSAQRLNEISSSSKHPPTWPGSGMLSIVNGTALYPHVR